MTRHLAPLLSLGLLALALGLSSTAMAGPATDAIKQMQHAAQADDVDTLDKHVDYDAIARASLDEHWGDFTDEERAAFVANFRTIVRRAYKKGLSGKTQHELRFTGESESPKGPLVHTRVTIKKGEPELSIDYLMHCAKTDCRLIDVVTDGSSLVTSWKRMFHRIIKRDGKAELLQRIDKKAKSED